MSARVESTPSVSSAIQVGRGWSPDWLTPERLLWTIAALTMALDVLTTGVGLRHGLGEGNPVMAGAIEHAGLGGLALAKAAVLGVGATIRLCLPSYRLVIPLGLATPGAIAVLVNSVLILSL